MRRLLLLLFLTTQSIFLYSQFLGGSGKGEQIIVVTSASLGESIFFGGNSDGVSSNFTTGVSMGENVFNGGTGDGQIIFLINSALLAENVFKAGASDGWQLETKTGQSLGESIFTGNIGDGVHLAFVNSQSLGESVYKGGLSDGWQLMSINNQSLGESIFAGGLGDGWSLLQSNSLFIGESIYNGGLGDGFTSNSSNNNSFAENIFMGGAGDGWSNVLVLNTPLPISLLNFSAIWDDLNGKCIWTTVSEKDNIGFILERSINGGISFDSIELIAGQGSTINKTNYIYLDSNIANLYPEKSNFIYKLTPIDVNANKGLSFFATLEKNSNHKKQFNLFPNPANQFTQITSINTTQNQEVFTIEFINDLGALVFKKIVNFPCIISTQEYASGPYTLRVYKGNELKFTQKFSIIH